MTEDDARRLLREQCETAGGQRAWARRHKLSAAYVSDVLSERRDIGPAICEALGLEKVIKYTVKFTRKA